MTALAIIAAAIAEAHPFGHTPEPELDDDLRDIGADSLAIQSMAVALEEHFGVEIPDSVVARWKTVGDVVRSVEVTPCAC